MIRPISKKLFIECIDKMEKCYHFQEKINEVYTSFGADGFYWWEDCSWTTLKLLNEIFKYHPDVKFIDYYCYRFDFGRKVTDRSFKDKNGQYIPIKTAEDLYDHLCEVD